ncbi:MAG: DUF167 domain-containing protein [Anaerolineales bacterium]|nr:DUF167 domain-containing protein [Anaerolineales bacterium]
MTREYVLHDGKRGSALALRITPRASQNQIVGILDDGTVKVHLTADPSDKDMNGEVVAFLAEVLGVPKNCLEVVAGENGRDKLLSVLDMDVETAHQRIVARME